MLAQPHVPGTVLAGHRIEAMVGRGGMGVVYRARDCRRGRLVALKVIAPEIEADAAARRRFREEALTAATVDHPNAVRVYDAGVSDGVAFLAMQYVAGMDLCAWTRWMGPLEPIRAAELTADLGGALDAVHRAGFVHRDVKPRNVLIARNGHVYLGDFGLARRIADRSGATRDGHWVGTADYAAPEQIRGGRTDARTDVYGLGCVLHFALTGRPPFARETVEARLWAHLYEPPPAPSRGCPGLPPEMDAVVRRALAKDPVDRFGCATELGRAALSAARRVRAAVPERPSARFRAVDTGFAELSTVSSAQPAPA